MISRTVLRHCVSSNANAIRRSLAQASEQHQIKEKWDLVAGVLVERLPVVSKSLTPLEKEFKDFLSQVEFENSLKSDHELRHERDLIQAELIKKGKMEIDLDDASVKQTAQDLKDAYKEEFKKFQLAPRETDDDNKNNLKSVNRKLEDNLYLFVEQSFGNKKILALPQGKRKEGETMRQSAERVLKEACGESINVFFFGNAPCGFYKYKYPASAKINDAVGAKVFFFRCTLKEGNVDEKVAEKYEWLDKSSLELKVKGSYGDIIQKLLL